MPVLGHAFVGLAMGMCTRPSLGGRASARYPLGSALWVPLAVVLAYLPDVAAQLMVLARFSKAQVISHSVLFAVLASSVIAPALSRIVPFSPLRLLVISLASILFHDLLDLAQATDRVPFWPFSERHVAFGRIAIPVDASREALLFGSAFLAFLICRHVAARLTAGHPTSSPVPRTDAACAAWIGRGAIILIMVAVGVTHYLRDVREHQLEEARILLQKHDYPSALRTLDHGERWPSTAKPGRLDYLRAEAYVGLGDRSRAEVYYLRAYQADPTYFWAVADLAIFYASSDAPQAERRRRIAPYLDSLRSRFRSHSDLPRVLATIERDLPLSPSLGPAAPETKTDPSARRSQDPGGM